MARTQNTHHLVIGNAKNLAVTLEKDGVPLVINPSTVVRALIQTVNMQPITCSPSTAGANWAQGVVAIPFTAAMTAGLSPTRSARIQIKVEGIDSFFAENVKIEVGEIPDL
jgi:hypothetical protein